MAFVWKAKESKFWQAGWRDENGKRRNKSTKIVAKSSTRREAEKIADLFEQAANKRKTAKHLRQAVNDLQREITGEDLAVPSFKDLSDRFLERKEGETGKATMDFYRGAVKGFSVWLGKRLNDEISTITAEDLARYRNHLHEKTAATTATNKLKALRAIFTNAQKQGFIDADPTADLKMVRKNKANGEQRKKRPFTVPEMKKILKEAGGEWRSMTMLGLYTGQRLGDLATIRWQDVNLETGQIEIKTRKTGRIVKIPIAPPLASHLESLDKPKNSVEFLHSELAALYLEQGSPQVSNQFSAILAKAGLREKVSHRKAKSGRAGMRDRTEVSFHSLRATAATLLHEAGIPAAVAQEFIGHDSEAVHRVYVQIGEENLKKASAALPNILTEDDSE
jgi:integrase